MSSPKAFESHCEDRDAGHQATSSGTCLGAHVSLTYLEHRHTGSHSSPCWPEVQTVRSESRRTQVRCPRKLVQLIHHSLHSHLQDHARPMRSRAISRLSAQFQPHFRAHQIVRLSVGFTTRLQQCSLSTVLGSSANCARCRPRATSVQHAIELPRNSIQESGTATRISDPIS